MCNIPILFLLFLVLLIGSSGSGHENIVVGNSFQSPFNETTNYTLTSKFGYRINPLTNKNEFHSGIDLGTNCGTDILASESGIIYEVGYSKSGLGNYVYIKHQTSNGILYSVYGHMLDDSIIVEKDEPIMKGQKIGQVGSTGASTGCHLHFTIMKNKISFNHVDLIDPYFIIYGLD